MVRVLHIISAIDPVHGGTAAAVTGLAEAQCRAGLDVSILSTYRKAPGHETAERLRKLGIKVDLLAGKGQLSTNPDLKRVTAEKVSLAQVVHIHAMWEEIQHVASRAAKIANVPYVYTPHGMLDPWSFNSSSRWLKKFFMLWRVRRNLNDAAAIHYATSIEPQVTAHWKLRPPAIVEPFGLDLREFETLPPAGSFRSRFPQLGDRPFVIFLGRQDRGKGLEILIPAFAQANLPNAMLVVAGPDWGNLQTGWEALAAQHGIRERVVFTGMLRGSERIAALAEARVFALPSFHENFGISVVEALASGVPVIVSDQVYLHPDVTAANVGEMTPLDAAAVGQALAKWMSDDALRNAAAARARPFVWERFDWLQIGKRWIEHYQRLISKRVA